MCLLDRKYIQKDFGIPCLTIKATSLCQGFFYGVGPGTVLRAVMPVMAALQIPPRVWPSAKLALRNHERKSCSIVKRSGFKRSMTKTSIKTCLSGFLHHMIVLPEWSIAHICSIGSSLDLFSRQPSKRMCTITLAPLQMIEPAVCTVWFSVWCPCWTSCSEVIGQLNLSCFMCWTRTSSTTLQHGLEGRILQMELQCFK